MGFMLSHSEIELNQFQTKKSTVGTWVVQWLVGSPANPATPGSNPARS